MRALLTFLLLRPLLRGLAIVPDATSGVSIHFAPPDEHASSAREDEPPLPVTIDAYREAGSERVSASLRRLPQDDLVSLLAIAAAAFHEHVARLHEAGFVAADPPAEDPMRQEATLRDRERALWIRLEIERRQRATGEAPGTVSELAARADRLLQLRQDQLELCMLVAASAEDANDLDLQRASFRMQLQGLTRAQDDAWHSFCQRIDDPDAADWSLVSHGLQCIRLMTEAECLSIPYREALDADHLVERTAARRWQEALQARLGPSDTETLSFASSGLFEAMPWIEQWRIHAATLERMLPDDHALRSDPRWSAVSRLSRQLTELGQSYREAVASLARGDVEVAEAQTAVDQADGRLLKIRAVLSLQVSVLVALGSPSNRSAFLHKAQQGYNDDADLASIKDAVDGLVLSTAEAAGKLSSLRLRMEKCGLDARIDLDSWFPTKIDAFATFVRNATRYAAVCGVNARPFLYTGFLKEDAPYALFALDRGEQDFLSRDDWMP